MGVELYEHNQKAYESALEMLGGTGKAAIIHPTGTGKSFIGFKLAGDHPECRICWLSPSEYIFKTQIENLTTASADIPDNITFYTYAKLMLMGGGGLAEIQPDYIILDEFHRCGAEMWGKGVQNLINMYPKALILGLSATNIRYLDNQRDMADELFDGNIASEMTLGEAIVRGILNPPKYVISVYSYQKDLENYQKKVRRAKNKTVRDAGEKYLDAIRRSLTNATGLDEVFRKHMSEKNGKYIVFSANLEHMNEMIACVPEWFGKVDGNPNIYRVYSDDPAADKVFNEFKTDRSGHLKLLFCIDMLNEGVHVDDVDGVILFRPTVSPIIYKQQIGRALCANKKKTPVIFDIVNNFENLYSIGTIEQEMQEAIGYYRSLGESGNIVNERFEVFGEIRDFRELFDALNNTLTASWDLMYGHAKQYYNQHGSLEVPRRYKTPGGYSLGNWIAAQRKVRAGEQYGNLDENRIYKLDEIGMIWEGCRDLSWERNYAGAESYYREHGDLNTNVNHVTENGIRLGSWICNLRAYRKSGIRQAYLTKERIAMLDAINMIWDQPDYLFEQNYFAALDYYRKHGDLDIPAAYITDSGIRLGVWIRNVRKKRKNNGLSEVQVRRLDEIGMLWNGKPSRQWDQGYTEALLYYKRQGDLNVPAMYVSPSGYRLGNWLGCQRDKYIKGKIGSENKKKLDSLGMIWDKGDPWEIRFDLAKAYFEEHGNLSVPANYTADGIWLNKWLNEQRNISLGKREGKSLTDEQKKRLLAIGFDLRTQHEIAWDGCYREAESFYKKHGHLNIPGDFSSGKCGNLPRWLIVQRKYYKIGKLTRQQTDKLTAIGMVWEFGDPWEAGFEHAEEYFHSNGNLSVPANHVCGDGYRLGSWISNQRNNYNNPAGHKKLTAEKEKRLERIGMVWNIKQSSWEKSYKFAADFYGANGHLKITQSYMEHIGLDLRDWLRQQRRKYWSGKLSGEQTEKLNLLRMDWNIPPRARVGETGTVLKSGKVTRSPQAMLYRLKPMTGTRYE